MNAIQKYFEELGNDPKIKEYFKSLTGLEIREACKKLGFWWRMECGRWPYYRFERSAGSILELWTNENNIVVSECHNGYALIHAKWDIYDYGPQMSDV